MMETQKLFTGLTLFQRAMVKEDMSKFLLKRERKTSGIKLEVPAGTECVEF